MGDVKVLAVLDGHWQLASCDGLLYLLTPCCRASTKGGQTGVMCRACYRPMPDWSGWGALAAEDAAVDSTRQLIEEHGGVLSLVASTVAGTIVAAARR